MNSLLRQILNSQKVFLRSNTLHSSPLFCKLNSTSFSPNMASLTDVSHSAEDCEFFINMSGGKSSDAPRAVLQYSWVDNNIIDMHHTGVPEEFRGQGVAKILAKNALNFAVEKNLKFYLTCTYLQKYVKDNPLPEYTERLLVS